MERTIIALLLAGAVMPLAAQTPPGAPMPRGGMRPGMLLRADANGDGVITRAEAIAAADARFDRLDADRNGTVTPDEMRAARDAMRGAGQNGSPPPPPQPADGARPMPPRPLGRAMTREQSRARALEAFDRADADHDGTINSAELARLADMRGGRGTGPGGDMPPPPPRD